MRRWGRRTVAGAVLALVLIATQFRGGKVLRSVAMAAAAGAPAVIWIGITLIVAKSDPSAALQPTRSLNELTVYAARPLDYLIPGPASAVTPGVAVRTATAAGRDSAVREAGRRAAFD